MRKIIIILIILQIVIHSCNYVKKKEAFNKIYNDFEQLYGNTLILPDSLNILFNNKIIPCNESGVFIGEFFIVSRIGGSCSRCIQELKTWKEEFMNKVDTSRLKFLFYIYTDDYRLFKNIIYPDIQIDYPLIIDKNNEFLFINHLPENDTRFHTFLLNENYQIILIGSPLHNRELETLYLNEIEKRTGF